jgi:hypothetical protein
MIPLDYGALAHQTIEFLKPVLAAAGGKIVKDKAGEIWEWLKSQFTTKPAAAAALNEVEQTPTNEDNWEALMVQIKKALKEDEGFGKRLVELLPKEVTERAISQKADITGNSNITAQSAGSGSIHINQPHP